MGMYKSLLIKIINSRLQLAERITVIFNHIFKKNQKIHGNVNKIGFITNHTIEKGTYCYQTKNPLYCLKIDTTG